MSDVLNSEIVSADDAREYLSQVPDLKMRDHYGRTGIHKVKTVEALDILLDAGADVNASEIYSHSRGSPPLHYVQSAVDPIALSERFLDAGADLRGRDTFGNTVMHHITDQRLITFFQEAGLSLDERNYTQQTPLHTQLSSTAFDFEYLEFMVERGADINAIANSHRVVVDNNIFTRTFLSGSQSRAGLFYNFCTPLDEIKFSFFDKQRKQSLTEKFKELGGRRYADLPTSTQLAHRAQFAIFGDKKHLEVVCSLNY